MLSCTMPCKKFACEHRAVVSWAHFQQSLHSLFSERSHSVKDWGQRSYRRTPCCSRQTHYTHVCKFRLLFLPSLHLAVCCLAHSREDTAAQTTAIRTEGVVNFDRLVSGSFSMAQRVICVIYLVVSRCLHRARGGV